VTRTASRVPPQGQDQPHSLKPGSSWWKEQESVTSPPGAFTTCWVNYSPRCLWRHFSISATASKWEHGALRTGKGMSLGGPRPLRQAGGSSEMLSELWSRTGPV
jgi:hypothetical protein